MSGGRLKIRLGHWGMLAVTVLILVLLNLVGGAWNVRWDLTENHQFTPSEGTRALLAELDDNLLVRGYFTPDLPPPYNVTERAVRELLDDYQDLSDGHLQVEFIDPVDLGDDADRRMQMMGIPMVQVTDVASDKVAVQNGYMAIAILFEDQQEIIPVVQSTNGLEFQLASKIRKLTGAGRKRVAVVQGFGAPTLAEEMAQWSQVFREQYDLTGVDLEAGDPLPENLDALLLVDPATPLSEWALAQVDQYLATGGGVGVFASGVTADLSRQYASDSPERLGPLPATWGLTLGRDLVADARSVRITVAQQRGIFTVQNLVDYAYIPSLIDLADQITVRDLESVFLPFVSTVASNPPEGVTYTRLIRSSRSSWRVTAPYFISPLQPVSPDSAPGSVPGPHPLAVVGEGVFPSAYNGQTVTPPGGEAQVVEVSNPAAGRLAVVGTGTLLRDAYLLGGENVPLVMNLIDWLARDESLIALRSRGVTDRPLDEVSDGTRQLLKAVNALGGALLLVMVGVIRWRLRQAGRRRLEGGL